MYGSKIGKIMIWDEEEDIFEQAVSSIFLIHTDESVTVHFYILYHMGAY
jgi:hypothetical protein